MTKKPEDIARRAIQRAMLANVTVAPAAPDLGRVDVFFGRVKDPCEDCLNGECTMNCSGAEFLPTIKGRPTASEALATLCEWLASYVWEEGAFGPYRDDVILDDVMNAGQARALAKLLGVKAEAPGAGRRFVSTNEQTRETEASEKHTQVSDRTTGD